MRSMSKSLPPSRTAPQFVVRFPDEEMRDRIAEAAKINNRSMNAEIVQRLQHSFTPWAERPWEERMVVDIDRASLRMLTDEERHILLERVKRAGGTETVNSRDVPIPSGPRLTENAALPPQLKEKLELADELAMAVLKLVKTHLPDNSATEAQRKAEDQLLERIAAKRNMPHPNQVFEDAVNGPPSDDPVVRAEQERRSSNAKLKPRNKNEAEALEKLRSFQRPKK